MKNTMSIKTKKINLENFSTEQVFQTINKSSNRDKILLIDSDKFHKYTRYFKLKTSKN